jgi:putative transposase
MAYLLEHSPAGWKILAYISEKRPGAGDASPGATLISGPVGRQNLARTPISNLGCMLELLWLLLRAMLAWVRSHHDLVLENLLLRHQVAVVSRPTRARPRPQAHTWDKLLWILARRFCAGWREHLAFVTPDTVVRWHRQGWRLFWRWKSRSGGGRPRLSPYVRELIRTMSRENRLWGGEQIRGELLKLGIVVSNRSIRRYRWRRPAHSPSQTWRTFLANHAHHLWAADLFAVPTLTFKTLYVLVFIAHGRRELVHVNMTANPTAAWVWRQLIEATPWGHRPRHLLRDRDAAYGCDFRPRARLLGLDAIATPVRSPRANAVAERVIGTLRQECLDHLIILDVTPPIDCPPPIRGLLEQGTATSDFGLQAPEAKRRPINGPIRSRLALGGLHHVYERVA